MSRITVEIGLTLQDIAMQSECRPRSPAPRKGQKIAGGLLCVEKIYHEPAVESCERGREILARFPDAQRIKVHSYWNIP